MSLFGTFRSMAFIDLLQWLGAGRKTGTLQIERNKISKAIAFKDGLLVGCSSDDPPERLGHFLLSRGTITEEQLHEALERQARSKKYLGMTLVEMGAFAPDELSHHLAAKAEETIFSLFEWEEAVFRFEDHVSEEASLFPVNLRVEDVLLRGLKRFDEMKMIREVFHDRGIVLRHTGKKPPQKLLDNPMGRTMYEAINDDRTLAEIVLHVHGSEYVVTKFLYELHRKNFVEISGIRPVEPEVRAGPIELSRSPVEVLVSAAAPAPLEAHAAEVAPDPVVAASASVQAQPVVPEVADGSTEAFPDDDPLVAWEPDIDLPPREPAGGAAATTAPAAVVEAPAGKPPADAADEGPDSRAMEPLESSDAHTLATRLERVRHLMRQTEFEQALLLLDELYEQFPGDDSLRRMTHEAEAAFVEKAYRHYLPPNRIPVLTKASDEIEAETLSPTEFFLLSRMDGVWNVRSIIQIAPLREADALLTLKRMRENGLIELIDPG